MIVVQPSKRIERHQTVPPADEDHAGLGLLDELVVGEQLQDFPRIHLFRGEMLELRKWICLRLEICQKIYTTEDFRVKIYTENA